MSRKLAVCVAVAVAATFVVGDSAFAQKDRKGRGDRGRPSDKAPARGPAPKRQAPKRQGPEHVGRGPSRGSVGGWGDHFGPKYDRSPDLERVLDMILRRQDKDEDRAKLGAALKSLINGSSSSSAGFGHHGGSYRNRYGRLDLNSAINYELRKQELLEDRKKLGDALKSLIKDASSECTTESVSQHSSGYCPPGYAPVVLESSTPSYYRYVNCD